MWLGRERKKGVPSSGPELLQFARVVALTSSVAQMFFWADSGTNILGPRWHHLLSNFCAASSLHVSNLWQKRLGFISSRWVGKGHSSFNLVLGLPFQVLAWICLVSCKVIDMFPSPRCDLVGQCHRNSLLRSLCALFGIYCDIVYILFSLLIVLGAMLGGLNDTAYSL